jgi:hypothetical protein
MTTYTAHQAEVAKLLETAYTALQAAFCEMDAIDTVEADRIKQARIAVLRVIQNIEFPKV